MATQQAAALPLAWVVGSMWSGGVGSTALGQLFCRADISRLRGVSRRSQNGATLT